jgi:hypothetical protein
MRSGRGHAGSGSWRRRGSERHQLSAHSRPPLLGRGQGECAVARMRSNGMFARLATLRTPSEPPSNWQRTTSSSRRRIEPRYRTGRSVATSPITCSMRRSSLARSASSTSGQKHSAAKLPCSGSIIWVTLRPTRTPRKAGKPYEMDRARRSSSARESCARDEIPSFRYTRPRFASTVFRDT